VADANRIMGPDPTGLLNGFFSRHDRVSSLRQRTISTTLLVVDCCLLVVHLAAGAIWHWKFNFGPLGGTIFVVMCCFAGFFVGLSSSLVRIVWGWAGSMWGYEVDEPEALTRSRKVVYYPGIFLNIVAIAVLVEQSGGLLQSPYSAVLLAVLLAAQQLGRFITNTIIFACFGILVGLTMFLFERILGTRTVSPPPEKLVFVLLVASYVVAAIFTYIDKRPNYRAAKKMYPIPTHIVVSRYSDGKWRYATQYNRFPLDPVLDVEASTLDEVKLEFERHWSRVGGLADGSTFSYEWSRGQQAAEATCRLTVKPRDQIPPAPPPVVPAPAPESTILQPPFPPPSALPTLRK
jgi:hypothetical protein